MLADQIRDRLASYLAKEISLDQFEDWIVQNTWDVQRSSEDEASKKLAYSVESKLSQYSSGDIPEDLLRRELSPLVTNYTPRPSVNWAQPIICPSPSSNITAIVSKYIIALFWVKLGDSP